MAILDSPSNLKTTCRQGGCTLEDFQLCTDFLNCLCELWVRIPVRQQVAEVQLIVFQAVCVGEAAQGAAGDRLGPETEREMPFDHRPAAAQTRAHVVEEFSEGPQNGVALCDPDCFLIGR
ncbi:unnamed protein product [Pleuronectes platessa]|uniref:Uncharacterized protein n=1 Tax=Pleuronectes platessa TaxID=8262 RepID=A0A9N7VVF8_PLEPL|nr:unnamed protein product [Pleuronectes platessa]